MDKKIISSKVVPVHAMKTYGGVKVQLHIFSALLGCYSESTVK
jgi:hypothetical protein